MIYGIKANVAEIQALRYPKEAWTSAAARSHCRSRKGILFEPAVSESSVKEIVDVLVEDGYRKEVAEGIAKKLKGHV